MYPLHPFDPLISTIFTTYAQLITQATTTSPIVLILPLIILYTYSDQALF